MAASTTARAAPARPARRPGGAAARIVGETADERALALSAAPAARRGPDGAPDVRLTLVLERPPEPGERAVGRLVAGGRLELGVSFAVDEDELAAAADELGRPVERAFVREGSAALVDAEGKELACAAVRGSLAGAQLEAALDRRDAFAAVDALLGRPSGLAVRGSLSHAGSARVHVSEAALEDVLSGAVVGTRLDAVASLVAPAPEGGTAPVPFRRTTRIRPRGERAVGGGESVALAFAGGRARALQHALVAGRPQLARPLLVGGGTGVFVPDDVLDPAAAVRSLPVVDAPEAPLWRDRRRENEYWYAPAFELVLPEPGRPAESAPFRFSFRRAGVTASGAPALVGEVLLTLRPVVRPETRAELDARGGPTARPVPRDGLGAVLEIPFVDERDGSLRRHAFPADVEDAGDTVRLRLRLLNEWVRLAYGALAEPGFQAEPARVRLSYAFSAYVPVREGGATVALGGKALATQIATAARPVEGPQLRRDDLVYELAAGGRLAFRRETRANARRRPVEAAERRPLLAAAIRPAVATAPVLTVRPLPLPAAALEELRQRVEYGERSVARNDGVDVAVPCARFGAFYLEGRDGGEQAIGCRDALLLGATTYRRFEEVAELGTETFRVFRSLQQPGRFLLLPAAYRIGRHEPGDGDDAYRATVLLYALLSGDPTVESRVVLDAALQPDVLPADRRRLRQRLLALAPDPRVDLPSEIPVEEVRIDWILPSGLTSSTRSAILPDGSIRATFEAGVTQWQLLRAMLERGGVSGRAGFVLGDGTTLESALELDLTAITGPPAAGAVSVAIADRTATLRNESERRLDVSSLDVYGPAGGGEVPVEALLDPAAARDVAVPPGTVEAYARYAAADDTAASFDEVRSYVEEIETNVAFVNLVDLEGRGLAALELEAQLAGVEGARRGRLEPGTDVVSLEFTLPLTTWLEQHVVRYRVTAERAGEQAVTGEWRTWDVARDGNVIGLQAGHLP